MLAHRQAFAWIDSWISMTLDEVREYEAEMHMETNARVAQAGMLSPRRLSLNPMDDSDDGIDGVPHAAFISSSPTPKSPSASSPRAPQTPTSPSAALKSWFTWS